MLQLNYFIELRIILHTAYLKFQMSITNFFQLKYSNLNVISDLEFFVWVHQVSTFSSLDYVNILHGHYK